MLNLNNYCKTKNTDELRNTTPEIKKLLLFYAPYALKKYQDSDNVYHKLALEIIDILTIPPQNGMSCNFFGLSNIGASCYLDSALFALFAVPSKFITKKILKVNLEKIQKTRIVCAENNSKSLDLKNRKKVQIELNRIVDSIRGDNNIKYCTDLRQVLKKCKTSERYDLPGVGDAGDFLQYILDMFPTNVATKQFINYATYDITNDIPTNLIETTNRLDTESSVIQFISSIYLSNLEQNKNHDIRNFLELVEDSGELEVENWYNANGNTFPRIITKLRIINTPYLIFRFERLHTFTQEFVNTKIIPSQTVTLRDLSRFVLCAIVVYKSVHYTTYFRCRSDWYYYDDTKSNIIRIGEFEKMLTWNPSPITNGTLYYYDSL